MINGMRLAKLRKEKGLSQQELGKMVGVSKSAICCYEKEMRCPPIETILDFMHIFAVSADYLLGADKFVEVNIKDEKLYKPITQEEIKFIEELKKDKFIYNILFEDPKRGADLIKKKLG